jgi:LPXTG-motif cell wall-anchored protein
MTTASASQSTNRPPPRGTDPALPTTGFDLSAAALLGVAVMCAGVALRVASRRRTRIRSLG